MDYGKHGQKRINNDFFEKRKQENKEKWWWKKLIKIRDLIIQLLEYNLDAEITTPYSETIALSYICENNATKKTTNLVFIEGCDYNGEIEN